jgi:hypothetical protein
MNLSPAGLKKFYLISCFMLLFRLLVAGCKSPSSSTTINTGEIEATTFQGAKLKPISEQNNNALAGTQHIDQANYTLTIDGLS